MNPPAIRRWDRESALLAQLAVVVSVISFLFYFRNDSILLYGDAVAHINIARKVFDSQTPGPLQLGTVWLPLPHLLLLPFVFSNWAWQTGLGGSIPSLVAYVAATLGIFRLVRGTLSNEPASRASGAAWTAALIFFANPNLIYLQSTAMTEVMYLAFFIWAVVYFSEFLRQGPQIATATRSLLKCGACLAAACLVRYDGWFLTAFMGIAAVAVAVRTKGWAQVWQPGFRKFVIIAAAAPVLWLAYNAIIYRNPLEFANGPYSAKAIELRTATPGSPPHPGTHNLAVAAAYFLKSAELSMMESNWHRLWLLLLGAGAGGLLLRRRKAWPLLFLLAPLPFYALSVAYQGVPIFLPVWWPFSFYNVRYGIQLLPAFAVFSVLAVMWIREFSSRRGIKPAVSVLFAAFLIASYATVWHAQPVAFREAAINSRTRVALERALAARLQGMPPDARYLMYLGDHVGAFERAGIPLKRVIYEGNHRTWKEPYDPEGLWERALAHPVQFTDFVIAFDGDAVEQKVNRDELRSILVIHVPGQPQATIYTTHPAIAP